MKSIKYGNVILCEHVVTVAGGKHTLVNVFSGDLLFQDIPGTIVLGLYVELLPQAVMPDNLDIQIFLGNEPLVDLRLSLEGHRKSQPAILALPMLPVEVKQETQLRVRLKADGFKSVDILKRGLLKAPFPIA